MGRRLLRVLFKFFTIAITLLLALLLLARLALETPAGERWLLRQVEKQANAQLVGDIRLEKLKLIGWSQVRAQGVELFSPEGEQLAFLSFVQAKINLPSLLKKRIHLSRLEARGLHADLVPNALGELPIFEALQPKEKQAEEQKGSNFSFSIERGEVLLGRIRYFSGANDGTEPDEGAESSEAPESIEGTESSEEAESGAEADLQGPPLVSLQGGVLRGRLQYRPLKREESSSQSKGQGQIAFSLRLNTHLQTPATGETELLSSGLFDQGRLSLSRLEALLPGGIQFQLDTSPPSEAGFSNPSPPLPGASPPPALPPARDLHSPPNSSNSSDSSSSHTPDFFTQLAFQLNLPAGALLPYGGPQLSEGLRGSGKFQAQDQDLQTQLSLLQPPLDQSQEGGGGEIRVRAEFKPAPKDSGNSTSDPPEGSKKVKKAGHFWLFVELRNIDPSRLFPQAPQGSVFAAAQLEGKAEGWPKAAAKGELWLAPSRIEGLLFGPGHFLAQTQGRELELLSGQLQLPGAALEMAQGSLSLWPSAASWRLDSAQARVDFSDLTQLKNSLKALGLASPDLGGSAKLELSYDSQRAKENDSKTPSNDRKTGQNKTAQRAELGLRGMLENARSLNVHLTSPLLNLNSNAIAGLQVDLRKTGKKILLQSEGQGSQGALWLAAEARVGRQALRILSFDLGLGDERWLLSRPSTLDWGKGRLLLSDFSLQGPGSPSLSLNLPIDLAQRSPSWRNDLKQEARLQITQLNVALLAPLLPQMDLKGLLSLDLALTGSLASPQIEAKASVDALRINSTPQLSGKVSASLTPTQALAQGWLMVASGALLNMEGQLLPRSGRSLLRRGSQLPSLDSDTWKKAGLSAKLSLDKLDLPVLSRAGLLPPDLMGQASAELSLSGSPLAPTAQGQLEFRELALGSPGFARTPELAGRLDFVAEKQLRSELKLQIQGVPHIFGQFKLQTSLEELIRTRSLGNPGLSASFHLERGPIHSLESSVMAEEVALELELNGSLRRPTLVLRADAEGLQVKGKPVGRLKLAAQLSNQTSDATLSLAPLVGGPLHLKFSGPGWQQAAPWSLGFEASHTRLDILELVPRLRLVENAVLSGALQVQSQSESTLPKVPALALGAWAASGEVKLAARRVAIAQAGTLQNLELDLSARKSSLHLDRLALKTESSAGFGQGPGALEASGAFHLVPQGWRLVFDAKADNFPVPTPLQPAGHASSQLSMRLAEDERHISGSVKVDRGELKVADRLPDRDLHPVNLPEDYVVHGRKQVASKKPKLWEQWLAKRSARIEIDLPPGFWVRSALANVEVSANTILLWDGSQITLEGKAEVVRGTLILVRRRFDVDRLVLSFVDRPLFDPDIDARLLLDDRDLQVTLNLSGRLRSPQIDLSSNPPMSPAELALLLASGGGGGLAVGSGVAGSALSGALNLVAGQLGQAISDFLPLDVLAFELGPSGEARQIEAGTYVTPDLFVSYIRNLFAQPNENTNEVQAEYQLGRRTSLRTRFGDRQSGGIEVLYQITLLSKSQRERGKK